MKAYTTFGTRTTPQHEAIPGEKQVKNNAGGYVFQLDAWKAFERFLILGSEGGSYYVGERKLTKENALRSMACIDQDGRRAVQMIVDISDSGRAPKNDPAIFALAIAAGAKDKNTRRLALDALPKVCRIPTHLFHFMAYVKQFRGLGRGLRTALARWYNDMPVEKLAYEVVKYQQRDGWANSDVLRLSHPKTADPARNAVYRWCVDGIEDIKQKFDARMLEVLPETVRVFEEAKTADPDRLDYLIRTHKLTREMIPTEHLDKARTWDAMLSHLPLTQLIRNLGNMSKCGLLTPLSDASRTVCERLRDASAIKKARVHPIAVLLALKTYGQGKGMLGKGEWKVVTSVVDALDDAFYLAFDNVVPTGKRILFGLDVSGSMGSPCAGTSLTCAEGAAAMALVCAKTEQDYHIMGFTAGTGGSRLRHYGKSSMDGFIDLGISPRMRLDDTVRKTNGLTFGATDCALPMVWAEQNKAKVDAFVVITDNETWAGTIHPKQALRSYREKSGIEAKQVVMGMTAINFTIADPKDPLTLDVVGFDASAPQVIAEFIRS